MESEKKLLDKYSINVNGISIQIEIITSDEKYVPIYLVSIMNITDTTKIILEKIREEFVSRLDLTELEHIKQDESEDLKRKFTLSIAKLIQKYFPESDEKTKNTLINYLLQENLGLGKIDILLKDANLEEIVVNNHSEPVWVYHKKFGWLETNIRIMTEARIRHYSTMIGRDVNKEITALNPLMDAHLLTGDRVNATLNPISSKGNTITIRKFAEDPWTITKFLEAGTITPAAAALIWLGIQNELSIMIAGGTGSGKTSMLNVVSNFLPPNQRIISIEDTRELQLSKHLHWVPLETRLPNPEGKGGVTMLDLLVNSLRMRPDRIIVGEIRRKEEAQVLMEAMHTGHSVYATIHANNSEETITRLTNPPIEIPKPMLASLSMILVQNRNRRTGKRITMQIAEMTKTGDPRILMQFNAVNNTLEKISDAENVISTISLYTGMTRDQLLNDLKQKEKLLLFLVEKKITSVDDIGKFMANYYTGKLKSNKD
ncbi:MAG: ATPase, T2SS/T4P/T4SS family [Candidatus Woesearchaeota archaeon]|jgi:flagellar protein FlaI